MKQVMRLFPQRLSQIFLIQPQDLRILVGFTNLLSFVFAVNRLDAGQPGDIIRNAGLAASADTSSRACHDLHEMVPGLPVENTLD